MREKIYFGLLLLAGMMALYLACSSSTGPDNSVTISSVTPERGPVGTSVSISGKNFGDSTGALTIGGINATVSSWQDTLVATIVPENSHPGNLVVATDDNRKDSVFFTVENIILDSISPDRALSGDEVSIYGDLFGSLEDTVTFNGIPAEILAWSDDLIWAVVPTEATSGDVIVKSGIEESNCLSYMVVQLTDTAELLKLCNSVRVELRAISCYEHMQDGNITDTMCFYGIPFIQNDWKVYTLIWDGDMFSVEYSLNYIDQNTIYDSVIINGSISEDGGSLINVSASYYSESTTFIGVHTRLTRLFDFDDLPLDSIDFFGDGLIFHEIGEDVPNHVNTFIDGYTYSDMTGFGSSTYLYSDWYHSQSPPEIIVTFGLQKPER
jgi:hypothetical protein